jgi:hypothetical protein
MTFHSSRDNSCGDVNSFSGSSISEVHTALLKEMLIEPEYAMNDDGQLSMQAKLDFVSTMRYFGHQATLDPTYVRECYMYDGILPLIHSLT